MTSLRATTRASLDDTGLLAIAGAHSASPGAALIGVVAGLLTRYSGKTAVTLRVDVDGVARRLRVDVDGAPSTGELVSRAEVALAAAVADESRSEGHALPGIVDDADVHVVLGPVTDTEGADLVISASKGGIDLDFGARIEAIAADRITSHVSTLIAAMASAADARAAVAMPVACLPLVDGEEHAWLLARSNACNILWNEALPSVVALFEAHARKTPDAPALQEGARTYTYAETNAAADALAALLRARVGDENRRVAVYLERGAYAVIAFLGILKARATYVPIDVTYPQGRVAAILAVAAPAVLLTRAALSADASASLEFAPPRVLVDDPARDEAEGARIVDVPPGATTVRPDDIAYTIFTSGSTGQPKGVVVDHRALASYARAVTDAYGLGAHDRVLQAASLGFDLSLEEIVITLTAGACLVFRSAAPIASVQSFVAECDAARLTVLSITSALWHELTLRLDDGSVRLPERVRLVILGADVARPDILTVWRRATDPSIRLVNSYGLTETTIVATVWEDTRAPLGEGLRALPVGRPLRNASTYVLDAHSAFVPVGVAGEVCVGGLAVARGYLGDEALTRARFVPDPFLPGHLMYRTGDRGILGAGGDLQFLGRADYQIKVNGVRIELGEIETRLRELPGVVEGVVVAQKNHAGETELDAHVMVTSSAVTAEALRAHLQLVIPLAAVPARFHVVDRFPLTPAGKIDRRALAARVTPSLRVAGVDQTPPSTPTEELVVRAIAEVLGRPSVGVLDDFVRLGGTSLAAVRAASLLAHRMSRPVRAQVFLDGRTLREASADLASPMHTHATSLVPLGSIARDQALDPAIVALGDVAGRGTLANVLVTGATGFFGAFVLAELLRETSGHVTCIVRAASLEEARARLVANAERLECGIEPDAWSRVTAVAGDLAAPFLGLAPADYKRLAATVDTVFHVGARVNMMLPYSALRGSNVVAVESVLRFATTARAKTVHHVSTVEVLADTDPGDPQARQERRAAATPELLHEGYGQTKWVAEKLVEEARARGIHAYIHRPGRLMGHSRTGAFNAEDFLVRMLAACVELGAVPHLETTVDLTAVDDASRMLVRLARRCPSRVDTFHLVHPEGKTWASLVADLGRTGARVQLLPHAEWQELLQKRAATSERGDFLRYLAGMSGDVLEAQIAGGFASDKTRAVLEADVSCAPVDARLLATYIRALGTAGIFPAPTPSLSPKTRGSVFPPPRDARGRVQSAEETS